MNDSFTKADTALTASIEFSEEEYQVVMAKLWELLKAQTEKYNGLDSTSVTEAKAEDILESLIYTIGVAVEAGTTKEELLNGKLSEVIAKGRKALDVKRRKVLLDWKCVCSDMPQIGNVYFINTVKAIGCFFKKYETYYEAHQIPCDIDYWLLCQAPEEIKGISFIEQYVYRLQIENDFLNCFERAAAIRLYKEYVPAYKETLFNLCDPVLTNAIGIVIAEELYGDSGFAMRRDIREDLSVSEADRIRLLKYFKGKDRAEIQYTVNNAVQEVCERIGMCEEYEKQYFTMAVAGMAARIYEAADNEDLTKVFIA